MSQIEPLWVFSVQADWHSLNRNAWHYETEITGTNRTEISNDDAGTYQPRQLVAEKLTEAQEQIPMGLANLLWGRFLQD